MNKYIIALCMSTFIFTASAQDMKTIIRQMPDTIIRTLSKNNILDFVDYHESNMKAEVTNELGYMSEMTQLTADYSFIRTSGSSNIQIKLLPLADSHIISLVRTVTCDSINADSQIEFYTTDWKPLPASDYFSFKNSEQFCRFTQNPDNTDIVISFHNPFLLDKDAKQKEPITLKWKEKYEEK